MTKLLVGAAIALMAAAPVMNTSAANVNFTGTVGLLEVRTTAWGSLLIITILDGAGNRMKLCDAAADPTAMAISLSDATAINVQANALAAKIKGKIVQGWGLDSTVAAWCGIGNFAIM